MKSFIARIHYRLGWKYISLRARISGCVRLGKRVYVGPGAHVIASHGSEISVGADTAIYPGAMILSYGGNITIGENVGVNPYCILYGHGGLVIGNNVLIASHTVIIPANHNFSRSDIPINSQGLTCRGVTIGNDVWLGSHSVILDGTTVEEGSVVGAGSVVTKNIPPYSIAVGVPARVVKQRSRHEDSVHIGT